MPQAGPSRDKSPRAEDFTTEARRTGRRSRVYNFVVPAKTGDAGTSLDARFRGHDG
jgi:hypothetical protein